eukprot:tig00020590_g11623.t1
MRHQYHILTFDHENKNIQIKRYQAREDSREAPGPWGVYPTCSGTPGRALPPLPARTPSPAPFSPYPALIPDRRRVIEQVQDHYRWKHLDSS